MEGQVFKIHSDFYYVETQSGVYECKIREILKKQKKEVLVGDIVELQEINQETKQAFISAYKDRKSYIPRPKVANVDQIIIVTAIKEPELNTEQLNRYICLCEYFKIPPIICFNKEDLNNQETNIETIKNLYEDLGYKTVCTSALNKTGIAELKEYLKNKVTVFCGASGVGKSSIINILHPDINLRTGAVSEKTQRGTHTTRHSEIINVKIENEQCKVIDTPGFSHLKFNFIFPNELSDLFPEIKKYKNLCKFKDCTHTHETGCNVIEHLKEIADSRYQSYTAFLKESLEYKDKITYEGRKKETFHKKIHNKEITKISNKKRELNRKNINQNLSKGEN